MSELLISVIMSVYDTKEEWLRECIESILNQTYRNFEFIIIIDCPNDNSKEIVEEYARKDKRIIILNNSVNCGLTKNLNMGLKIAKGKYIARMDADDVSFPNRFEVQLKYMEQHPGVAVVGSRVFSPESSDAIQYEFSDDPELLRIRLLFKNVGIPHPTAFIRKAILDQYNIRYTEEIKKSQDYKLWVDISKHGNIVMLPDVLLMYRIHNNQISADKKSQFNYAHVVAIMQAEELLGELSEGERNLHLTAAYEELNGGNTHALSRYFGRILETNKYKQLYNQKKMKIELSYMWCRKAVRRLLLDKRPDMIFHWRTLSIITPRVVKEFIRMRNNKKSYQLKIEQVQKEQYIKLCDQKEL